MLQGNFKTTNIVSALLRRDLTGHRLIRPLRNVLLFLLLIVSFHFLYLLWQSIGYWPVEGLINRFFVRSGMILFNQSALVIDWIGLPHTIEGQTFYFTSRDGNQTWLTVSPGCASLKQWMHWIFLMLLFPGPWKHKLWFIPLGILIIQLASVARITGIAGGLYFFPQSFAILHDYVFKIFFYFVIFLLWVVWVEFFRNHSEASKK